MGSACPAGQWPENLPTTAVIYVDPLASGDQDGSIGNPFATINQALIAAAPNTTIALAKGRYAGTINVRKNVSIVGACPEETTISRNHIGEFLLTHYCKIGFAVDGASLTLKDLTVADAFTGVDGRNGAQLHLIGTHFEHTAGAVNGTFDNITIEDSYLDAQRAYADASCVVASSALPLESGGNNAQAGPGSGICDPIILPEGCLSTATDVTVRFDSHNENVTEGSLTIRDSVVTGGAVYQPQTQLPSSIVVENSSVHSVIAESPASIRQTICGSELGLILGGDAEVADSHCNLLLSGSSSLVERHRGQLGVNCPSGGAIVEAHDVMQQSFVAREPSFLTGACTATMARMHVLGTRGGLMVDRGAEVTASDIVVKDVTGVGNEENWTRIPVGLGVYSSALLSVERFVLSGSPVMGAQLGEDGGMLQLRSGLVEGNLIGVNVQVPNYDLSLVQDSVTWKDNTVNLDAQSLQPPPSLAEFVCDDETDNDEDGRVDCADTDCLFAPGCGL